MSMDLQTVVANILTLNTNTFVHPALQGLSDADLLKRPSDQCNPIGWLLWHQSRVEDAILSHISGRPQAWVAGTWHEHFGMPADLERELPFPAGGTRKVGDFLGILMIDQFHHSGQIAYLRGYVTGKGWFPM